MKRRNFIKNMGDFNSKPGGEVYRGDVKVNKYENVDYNVDGVYPSDHKPVVAEFEIR